MEKQKVIFQHDNDPKHTASSVKEWLSNQEFEAVKWPAQSPDLNPIENMWALLKKRLYRDYERPPKGMIEHWERIAETWYKITKEDCQKVVDAMYDHCQQAIVKKGHWIDYWLEIIGNKVKFLTTRKSVPMHLSFSNHHHSMPRATRGI